MYPQCSNVEFFSLKTLPVGIIIIMTTIIIIIIIIIEAGRPDIVVVNKQDRKCGIIDVTVSILVNSGFRNIYLAAFC